MRELSLNILDIAQNSIAADAALITITVEEQDRLLTAVVEDNGRGMTPEQVEQVQSPFYTTRTTRPVGLGVPLFKMACEQTGGRFSIVSTIGEGTAVRAEFHADHIDMTPLGDMNETIQLLISCNPDIDFVYNRILDGVRFQLDTRQLREILGGDVALNAPEVSVWIREYLAEQEETLRAPPAAE